MNYDRQILGVTLEKTDYFRLDKNKIDFIPKHAFIFFTMNTFSFPKKIKIIRIFRFSREIHLRNPDFKYDPALQSLVTSR